MPSRSASRSPSPSTLITRPASTVSDGPTAIPCPRRASTNSTRWPGMPCGASGCGGRVRRTAMGDLLVEAELAAGLDLVGLVLEHHAKGGGDQLVVDGIHAQRKNRAPPVDGLGYRRHLLELHAAQHPDDADQLFGEVSWQLGYARQQDTTFEVRVGEVDVQEQAATLERLGQL